jgi:hypothetical protein
MASAIHIVSIITTIIFFSANLNAELVLKQEKNLFSHIGSNTEYEISYVDSLNYLIVSNDVNITGHYKVDLISNGNRSIGLQDSIASFLSQRSISNIQLFYDFPSSRYLIFNGKSLAQADTKKNTFNSYGKLQTSKAESTELKLKQWEGPFGDKRLLAYYTHSSTMVQHIFSYRLHSTGITIDTLFTTKNPTKIGIIQDFDIDPINGDLILFTVTQDFNWKVQNIMIYRNNEELNSFDFTIPEYTNNYGNNKSISLRISSIQNIDNNVWMINMKQFGYFVSVNNGVSWDYVERKDWSGEDYGAQKIIKNHYGELIYLSDTDDDTYMINKMYSETDIGSAIAFQDINGDDIGQLDSLSPINDFHHTPFATYMFDRKSGWIYSLLNTNTSVQAEYGVNDHNLYDMIKEMPKAPVEVYSIDGRFIKRLQADMLLDYLSNNIKRPLLIRSHNRTLKVIP